MTIALPVVIGVLLVALAVWRLRGGNLGWSARADRVIELRMNASEATRLVERSIAAFDLTDGPIRHPRPQTIAATMSGNGKAFGNVEVRIQALGSAKTRLQITANPIVPQLWDWGRSRSIVSRIASDLLAKSA